MKRMMSILLAMLLAIIPAMGLAGAADDVMAKAIEDGRAVTTEVALSVGALAGLDESTAAVVKDLCDAIGVSAYQQKDQVGFALNMSGQPVVFADVLVSGDTAYLASNLLGKAVRLSADDVSAVTGIFVKMTLDGQVAAGEMTQEQADQVLAEMQAQMDTAMGSVPGAEDVDLSDLTFERTMTAALALAENVEPMTDFEQPENCDPAVSAMKLTMTSEQVRAVSVAMLEDLKASKSLMDMMDQMLSGADAPAMTELLDQIEAQLENDENLAKMGPITVIAYADAAEELVAMSSEFEMTGEDGRVSTAYSYARLTAEDGVHHTLHVTAAPEGDDGDDTVTMNMTFIDGDGRNVASFVAAEGGVEVLHVNVVGGTELGENTSATVYDVDLGLTDDDTHVTYTAHVTAVVNTSWNEKDAVKDAEYKLYLNGAADEIAALKVHIATADAVPAVAINDAVTFSSMDEEAFGGWLNDVIGTLQMQLISAVQLLPDSVLMLLMGQ